MVNDMAQAAAPNAPSFAIDGNSASIRGNVSRLIDPNTMLMHGDKPTRTITMVVAVDGAEFNRSTMIESRVYEYQY